MYRVHFVIQIDKYIDVETVCLRRCESPKLPKIAPDKECLKKKKVEDEKISPPEIVGFQGLPR